MRCYEVSVAHDRLRGGVLRLLDRLQLLLNVADHILHLLHHLLLLSLLPPPIADRIGKMTARLVLGDLSRYGLPHVEWGPYLTGRVPVIDVGFVNALKREWVEIRPALVRLTATQAVYADGRMESFDAIIANGT